IARSPDGISRWSEPTLVEDLKEPVCMASLARLTARPEHDRDRLVFANPDHFRRGPGGVRPARANLTVKLSYDEGRSWPVGRVLDPGPSAYSALAVGPGGRIYCLYESGRHTASTIRLARFDLKWLTGGEDRPPADAP